MKRGLPVALLSLLPALALAAETAAPLRFRVDEGRVANAFYRQGPVAAHLLLTSGTQPRVLAAFPAGNSGVGVWFADSAAPVQWTLGEVRGVERPDWSRWFVATLKMCDW